MILVKIEGHKVLFGNTINGAQLADIKGLKLDYGGVCRQFPDLELRDDWREEAISRFKEKIRGFKTEQQVADYIIVDLRIHGYTPKRIQQSGHRPRRIR